jgi:protein required for attachment to host cells
MDWHQIEEHRFAKNVAIAMEEVVRISGGVDRRGAPRNAVRSQRCVHADMQTRIIAEINRDLTKHPVGDIEKHLTAA